MNEKKINYNIVNTCLNVQYKFEFELNYSGLHYKMDCSGNEIVINYKTIILKIRLKYQYFLKQKNIVVNLKWIERVKNERGRDRAFLNTNPTKIA